MKKNLIFQHIFKTLKNHITCLPEKIIILTRMIANQHHCSSLESKDGIVRHDTNKKSYRLKIENV